jgi:hypothetical protein
VGKQCVMGSVITWSSYITYTNSETSRYETPSNVIINGGCSCISAAVTSLHCAGYERGQMLDVCALI